MLECLSLLFYSNCPCLDILQCLFKHLSLTFYIRKETWVNVSENNKWRKLRILNQMAQQTAAKLYAMLRSTDFFLHSPSSPPFLLFFQIKLTQTQHKFCRLLLLVSCGLQKFNYFLSVYLKMRSCTEVPMPFCCGFYVSKHVYGLELPWANEVHTSWCPYLMNLLKCVCQILGVPS